MSSIKYLLCCLLLVLLSGCNQSAQVNNTYPYTAKGMSMGTSYSIKASELPRFLTVDEVNQKVKEVLDKVNHQMSTYLNDSELSLFNKNTNTEWIPVSSEFYKVVDQAIKTSQMSGGLFDVTVGPLVNLWGFGPDDVATSAPSDILVKDKLKQIGYDHLKIKEENGWFVKKDLKDLYVDLSGIAKGYGVDQVAELFESLGMMDYMVEIGGEIRVKGKNISGQPWHIAVEKPTEEMRVIEKVLEITDTGMATSGDYRNYFEVDGKRFSHTIDPRTGRPITHKLASITILKPTSMEADALATAIMVMGPEQGSQFAETYHVPAFFIIKSDKGFEEKMSTAFVKMTKVKQ